MTGRVSFHRLAERELNETEIRILAVMHPKRPPMYWVGRE